MNYHKIDESIEHQKPWLSHQCARYEYPARISVPTVRTRVIINPTQKLSDVEINHSGKAVEPANQTP